MQELEVAWSDSTQCNREAADALCILWNKKVRYCVHKSPPLDPILSYMKPVHTLTPHFSKIHLLSSHLWLGLPTGLLPSGFPPKILYEFLISPIYATCPANLILIWWT
jgi:hypothetical protein